MPKNSIFWGQGAVNNSIGWGAGASANTISWGKIHAESYGHDETNLVGMSEIVKAYLERVTSDGGVVEATSCLNSKVNKYIIV